MKLTPAVKKALPRVIELAPNTAPADIARIVGITPSTVRRILGSLPQLIAQLEAA
jgi:DNA-binding IclR family transcriptional regulator